MSVISLSSLKGGVGKTSLSINVSHAFAQRGCRTLLIDLDPAGHSTSFFKIGTPPRGFPQQSPLARLFLSRDGTRALEPEDVDLDQLGQGETELIVPIRPNFDLLPAGSELRYFLWGHGPKAFIRFFPRLIEELNYHYDNIVIDTPPDFNVLTRNAIASSDLVTIPVDSSGMSISSLEELVINAQHISGPSWAICRTMVNKQATRVRRLSDDRLSKSLNMGGEDFSVRDEEFISLLRQHEARGTSVASNGVENPEPPLYLLQTEIRRTEHQNRLTFLGKTAFDSKATSRLAEDYHGVASEMERILALRSPEESSELGDELVGQLF